MRSIDELVREGMFYPVYRELLDAPGGEETIPEADRERARQTYYEHVSKGAATRRAAERTLAALDGIEIPLILLKGPAIDFLIYDGFMRPRLDLDVVIREDDWPAMEKELAKVGYAPRRDDIGYPVPEHLESRVFTAGSSDMMSIHLHRSPFNNMYLTVDGFFRPDMARVWSETEPFGGYRNIVVLKPAMNIVYLCDHAMKHGFDQLVLAYEIEELMRRYGERLNRDEVIVLARELGLEEIIERALKERRRGRYAAYAAYVALRKGWAAKTRFVWLTLFPPGFTFVGYVKRIIRFVG